MIVVPEKKLAVQFTIVELSQRRLTGLSTALAFGPAVISCRRRYHYPEIGYVFQQAFAALRQCWAWPTCASFYARSTHFCRNAGLRLQYPLGAASLIKR
jgi:hypothetical protein